MDNYVILSVLFHDGTGRTYRFVSVAETYVYANALYKGGKCETYSVVGF